MRRRIETWIIGFLMRRYGDHEAKTFPKSKAWLIPPRFRGYSGVVPIVWNPERGNYRIVGPYERRFTRENPN